MAIVKVGLVQMTCEASKTANTAKAIEKIGLKKLWSRVFNAIFVNLC